MSRLGSAAAWMWSEVPGAPQGLALGGSAMLAARGLTTAPGDLDVVAEPWMRAQIEALPARRLPKPGVHPAVASDWLVRLEVCSVQVDVMCGMRWLADGAWHRIGTRREGWWVANGVRVPLAGRAEWYHFYRTYRPAASAALAPGLESIDVERAARRIRLIGFRPYNGLSDASQGLNAT